MESLQFSCSRCNRPLGCEGERAGQPGRCPTCGEIFLAPTTIVGGRGEGGEFYTPAPGEVIPDFEDQGAFGTLRVDEEAKEKRRTHERRTKIGRARKKSRWRRRFERLALWLVLIAAVALVAGYVMSTWKSREAEPAVVVELDDDGAVEMARMEEARDVVTAFLDAETFDDKIQWIRDVERVEPLMREYYGRRGIGKEPYRRLMDPAEAGMGWSFFDMTGLQFVLVEMENYTVRVLVMEFTDEGPRVDWESWVIYGENEWADFRREQPREPVLMRPIVMASDYYNFGYADPEKWACYRLTDPEQGDGIYGYVEKGSEIDRTLDELVAAKGSAWPVLKVKWPEERRSGQQVEIVELLSERWVMD
ncbi:MAG: hypothetical protein AAF591_16050 [Verrucomicrobiota bacterium]